MKKECLKKMVLFCFIFCWVISSVYFVLAESTKTGTTTCRIMLKNVHTKENTLLLYKKKISQIPFYQIINMVELKPEVPNNLIIQCRKENYFYQTIILFSQEKDSDRDGLSDKQEKKMGINPYNVDSDEDGLTDGKEWVIWGKNWNSDFDSDGKINILDDDSDGDGLVDGKDFKIRNINVQVLAVRSLNIYWKPNLEPDIEKYLVYIRKEGEKYNLSDPIWQGKSNHCQINIPKGVYYISVMAVDFSGQKSDLSLETKVIR